MPPPPASRRALVLATAGAFILSLAVFAGIGLSDWRAAYASVLLRLLTAGLPPAAYIAAAVGLGRLLRPLFAAARDPLAFQVAGGVALMLWLSHALGSLGLFAGPAGSIVGAAPVAIGCALALHQFARRERRPAHTSPTAPFVAVAAALLVVAACNPPGWLWASEFGGYDVLEYHLQLPQEWFLAGQLRSLPHNVYSFLPSYVEGAYLHLAAFTFAPGGDPGPEPLGLLAGEGWRLISCQTLHAGLAMLAAWTSGRAASAFIPGSPRAPLATALAICTPWLIVVGSLAYNEAPLVLLTAGSLAAAADPGLSPARRGLLTGFLVGSAASVKPTAVFFTAAPAAFVLAFSVPLRAWIPLAGAGVFGVSLAIAPWLARNALAGGNPVFPHLASLFGDAHWTPDQVERYLAHHRFSGSWPSRLALLFFRDESDPSGAPVHRGLLHPQWSLFFPVVLLSAFAASAARETRRPALILCGVLAIQLSFWLCATHVQSRFLLPAIVPGACLFALAAHRWATASGSRVVAALVPALLLAHAARTFARQRPEAGGPNTLLLSGPGLRTGETIRPRFRELPPEAQQNLVDSLSPEPFTNLLLLQRRGSLYLLGDATPLYFHRAIVYNTPYDAWPLAHAIRAAPDDPAAWSATLRSRGIATALVNLSEVSRLRRWGASDPLVTPDNVRRWLATTRVIREWHAYNVYLVDITQPPGSDPPGHAH